MKRMASHAIVAILVTGVALAALVLPPAWAQEKKSTEDIQDALQNAIETTKAGPKDFPKAGAGEAGKALDDCIDTDLSSAKLSLKRSGDLSGISDDAARALKSIISSGGKFDDPGLAELYILTSEGMKPTDTQKARFATRVFKDYGRRCETTEDAAANWTEGTVDKMQKEFKEEEPRKKAEKIGKSLQQFEELLKRKVQC